MADAASSPTSTAASSVEGIRALPQLCADVLAAAVHLQVQTVLTALHLVEIIPRFETSVREYRWSLLIVGVSFINLPRVLVG